MESSNQLITKEMGPEKKKMKSGRISPRVLFSSLNIENNMCPQTHEVIEANSKCSISWKPALKLNLTEPLDVESHQCKSLETVTESSTQHLNFSAPNNHTENVLIEYAQEEDLNMLSSDSENNIINEYNSQIDELNKMDNSKTLGINAQKSSLNLDKCTNLDPRSNFEKSFCNSSYNNYFVGQECPVNVDNALKADRHTASNIHHNNTNYVSTTEKQFIGDQFLNDKTKNVSEADMLDDKNKCLTEDFNNHLSEGIHVLESEKFSPELYSHNITVNEKSQNSLKPNSNHSELESTLKNVGEKRTIVIEELDTNKIDNSLQSCRKCETVAEIQTRTRGNVNKDFEKNCENNIFNLETCPKETINLNKESTISIKNSNFENLDPFQGTVSNSQFLRLECEITESEKEQINHFVNTNERKVSLINENINGLNNQIEWQTTILKRLIQDIDELNKTVVKATAALKSQQRKLPRL